LLTLYKKIAKKRFVKHHKIIFLTLLFMPYVLPYYVFPYYVFIKKSIKMYKLNKELFIETRKKTCMCPHNVIYCLIWSIASYRYSRRMMLLLLYQ